MTTFFTWAILIYSVFITSSYGILAFLSLRALRAYMRKNSFVDYSSIISSPLAPSVSIIAPAYNEAMTIIQNARSLLSLHYQHFEVIIVNDGSKDDTLAKMIEGYHLEKTDYTMLSSLATKPVRGVYKSTDPSFNRLVVVDKVNGGKADALNVGINTATNQLIVCIDVDCIIEDDAILKLVKPYLEGSKKRIIAVGGVIRIANSCDIDNGRIIKVHLPKNILARFQVLEYLRAFLLARMAWAKLDGLLLISGAFGLFDKEIAINAGGYNHNTVGEDMELLVRMRRYMIESKQPYTVGYTPDPLCWTEAPESYKVLGRQRNRWTRGTMETLWFHRKMMLNPRYGILGMLSMPYWLICEWMSPWVESIGMLLFLILGLAGLVNWLFVISLLSVVFSFAIMISVFSIFFEEITFYQYKDKKDILYMLLTAVIEPFIYHPLTVFWALKGNYHLLTGNKSWGEMTRVGFANKKQKNAAPAPKPAPKPVLAVVPVITEPVAVPEPKTAFRSAMQKFASLHLALLGFFILSRLYETLLLYFAHRLPASGWALEAAGLEYDALLWARTSVFLLPFFMLGYVIKPRIGHILYGTVAGMVVAANLGLIQYFRLSAIPLGSDFYGYTRSEMMHTIGASGGLNAVTVLSFFGLVAAIFFGFRFAARRPLRKKPVEFAFYIFLIASFFIPVNNIPDSKAYGSDMSFYLVSDKLGYFTHYSEEYFFPKKEDNIYNEFHMALLSDSLKQHTVIFDAYPFLHKAEMQDVLSPFFGAIGPKPNIVIILVESLGRAYSGNDAYMGSFTPFLDSLSKHSLYWENGLSGGGRTFAVLPTVFSSAPFGEKGFLEMGNDMPAHQSLIKILGANGYNSHFYYGGDSHFDNMDMYLNRNEISEIIDEKKFGQGYARLPAKGNGFSWGFGDKDLFRKAMTEPHKEPFLDIFLTIATHDPFLIPDQDAYIQRFKKKLAAAHITEAEKTVEQAYENQFSCMMYLDDALRQFMEAWKKRPEYKNTIFIITGDHRMPEVPVRDRIDRFHVPVMIYSPMVKRPGTFSAVVSHFDIAPTLLSLLKSKGVHSPAYTQWIGYNMDTVKYFRNTHVYPMMRNKNQLLDYLSGEFYLSEDQLFRLGPGMALLSADDPQHLEALKQGFSDFRLKNTQATKQNHLIPDSTNRQKSLR